MIFDDFDDFDQLPKENSNQSKTKYKTSLESIFEDKQEEIRKGNLLDIRYFRSCTVFKTF